MHAGRTKTVRVLLSIGAMILAFLAAVFLYILDDYGAEPTAAACLVSTETVTVEKTPNGMRFDGPAEAEALIFYPGAKVEAAAYAPLLYALAEEGMDCFLVEMPLRMALFYADAADALIGRYAYEGWYMAGHSLGGVIASDYAAAHPDTIRGLILLASYPRVKLPDSLRVLSIYGTMDKVLSRERYEKSRALWPADAREIILDGGNHARFGAYGAQKGDGAAAMTPEEQRQATVGAILEWIAAV